MKRRWHWLMLLCLILMIPVSASANSPAPGPDYEFTLQIVNAPGRAYCTTILTPEPGATQSDWLSGVQPDQREMVTTLFSLEAEGWYPVSEVPEGGLIREARDDKIEWMTITQSMEEYRIILVSESGIVHVSDPVIHRDYASIATYDLRTNWFAQDIDYMDYGRRVLIAVGVTLVVELLLLKLFGFSLKKNLRVVVLTNLSTQLLLNFILFVTHYYEFVREDMTILLIMELVIPIIEAIVYAKFLQDRTIRRRVLYAFIANFTSFIIGMLIYDVTSTIYFLLFAPLMIGYWFNSLFNPAY